MFGLLNGEVLRYFVCPVAPTKGPCGTHRRNASRRLSTLRCSDGSVATLSLQNIVWPSNPYGYAGSKGAPLGTRDQDAINVSIEAYGKQLSQTVECCRLQEETPQKNPQIGERAHPDWPYWRPWSPRPYQQPSQTHWTPTCAISNRF